MKLLAYLNGVAELDAARSKTRILPSTPPIATSEPSGRKDAPVIGCFDRLKIDAGSQIVESNTVNYNMDQYPSGSGVNDTRGDMHTLVPLVAAS